MLYANAIRLKDNISTDNISEKDIAAIFIHELGKESGVYLISSVVELIESRGVNIKVNGFPDTYLKVISEDGNKYVKSHVNQVTDDSLLELPRK